jgi:copper chaperone CopZ
MSELISLDVMGMKCGGCEQNVTQKLQEKEGVMTVNACHKDKKIEVTFDEDKINQRAIEAVVIDAGYKVI